MGALRTGVILFFIVAAIGGYVATHPSILKDLNIDVKIGSTDVWTNSNFSTVADSPSDYVGDKVDLKVMIFNQMPKNGRVNKSAVEIEGYMGTYTQLESAPMDVNKRVYISYDPSAISYKPELGKCVEVKGYIAGQISLTTLDGSKLYPVYIKADSISEISCNNLG